jgi:hypothetical protein
MKRALPAEMLGLKIAAPHKRPDLKMCLAVLDYVERDNPSTDKPVASMLQNHSDDIHCDFKQASARMIAHDEALQSRSP